MNNNNSQSTSADSDDHYDDAMMAHPIHDDHDSANDIRSHTNTTDDDWTKLILIFNTANQQDPNVEQHSKTPETTANPSAPLNKIKLFQRERSISEDGSCSLGPIPPFIINNNHKLTTSFSEVNLNPRKSNQNEIKSKKKSASKPILGKPPKQPKSTSNSCSSLVTERPTTLDLKPGILSRNPIQLPPVAPGPSILKSSSKSLYGTGGHRRNCPKGIQLLQLQRQRNLSDNYEQRRKRKTRNRLTLQQKQDFLNENESMLMMSNDHHIQKQMNLIDNNSNTTAMMATNHNTKSSRTRKRNLFFTSFLSGGCGGGRRRGANHQNHSLNHLNDLQEEEQQQDSNIECTCNQINKEETGFNISDNKLNGDNANSTSKSVQILTPTKSEQILFDPKLSAAESFILPPTTAPTASSDPPPMLLKPAIDHPLRNDKFNQLQQQRDTTYHNQTNNIEKNKYFYFKHENQQQQNDEGNDNNDNQLKSVANINDQQQRQDQQNNVDNNIVVDEYENNLDNNNNQGSTMDIIEKRGKYYYYYYHYHHRKNDRRCRSSSNNNDKNHGDRIVGGGGHSYKTPPITPPKLSSNEQHQPTQQSNQYCNCSPEQIKPFHYEICLNCRKPVVIGSSYEHGASSSSNHLRSNINGNFDDVLHQPDDDDEEEGEEEDLYHTLPLASINSNHSGQSNSSSAPLISNNGISVLPVSNTNQQHQKITLNRSPSFVSSSSNNNAITNSTNTTSANILYEPIIDNNGTDVEIDIDSDHSTSDPETLDDSLDDEDDDHHHVNKDNVPVDHLQNSSSSSDITGCYYMEQNNHSEDESISSDTGDEDQPRFCRKCQIWFGSFDPSYPFTCNCLGGGVNGRKIVSLSQAINMNDSGSIYSVHMQKDFRYYFQHPYARLFVAYFVIFCNFLIFAEDPLSHSLIECSIPVLGNVISLLFTKYPKEYEWQLIKGMLSMAAIIAGLLFGKYVVHHVLLRRIFRLKMFRDESGTWMIMLITTFLSCFLASQVYNAMLLMFHRDAHLLLITSKMGMTYASFMKLAACGTWCGDFFTAWMITDMMLQDNLYPNWAIRLRQFWHQHANIRIVVFWTGSLVIAASVIAIILNDVICWDCLTHGLFSTTELNRAFLASSILVMDLLIVMQDWDFPHFVCDLNIKLPGLLQPSYTFNFFHKSVKFPEFDIKITGKWFNYGIIVFVMMLDLNMWKNQVIYYPADYGQYMDLNTNRVCSITDRESIDNELIWTYDNRSQMINPHTNRTYIEDDLMIYSRYVGYVGVYKATSLIPILAGFTFFFLLVYFYGRFPPKTDASLGGRLPKRRSRCYNHDHQCSHHHGHAHHHHSTHCRSSWRRERRDDKRKGHISWPGITVYDNDKRSPSKLKMAAESPFTHKSYNSNQQQAHEMAAPAPLPSTPLSKPDCIAGSIPAIAFIPNNNTQQPNGSHPATPITLIHHHHHHHHHHGHQTKSSSLPQTSSTGCCCCCGCAAQTTDFNVSMITAPISSPSQSTNKGTTDNAATTGINIAGNLVNSVWNAAPNILPNFIYTLIPIVTCGGASDASIKPTADNPRPEPSPVPSSPSTTMPTTVVATPIMYFKHPVPSTALNNDGNEITK